MARQFSLAHLTVLSLPPPRMVEVAARAGYDAVGLRLIAVTAESPGYPLMNDPAMLRETHAALADTELRVNDIEFVKVTPELDVATLEPFIATGAALGARHVICAPYDSDLSRLSERLGQIADLAKKHGLGAVLEFFPWTSVADLATAARIVTDAGRDNVGVLVDTLHFARSSSTLAELRAMPPHLLPFAHICDAAAELPKSTEEILFTARSERLPPGLGGLGVADIISALPADLPLTLEVPMDALTRSHGPEHVARACLEAARAVTSAGHG